MTDVELQQLSNDIGSALILVKEVTEKNGAGEEVQKIKHDWLSTKLFAIDSAEVKVKASGKVGVNPGEKMTPFERDCWENREAIVKEFVDGTSEPDVLAELSEYLDLSLEATMFLAENGMPVGDKKFETSAIDEWIKSDIGKPFFLKARAMTDEEDQEEKDQSDDDDLDDDEDDEITELIAAELTSQSQVANHFAVSMDEVKSWSKDGMPKDGKVYHSDDVFLWLKENSLLGENKSSEFKAIEELEIFESKSGFKIFTQLGTLIHEERLKTAEQTQKLLDELMSDIPDEEMINE